MLKTLTERYQHLLSDVCRFSETASGLRLRSYQEAAARAAVQSVMQRQGRSLVVMFPRQSGKNEVQAQLEAYLLTLFSRSGAELVKISPTWRPQSLNAMRRLERVLDANLLTRGVWQKESGYIYRLGAARILFLSGAPESHIVGATASTLLEVDEAQDVRIDKFDKEIAPMAASTNATRIFWGTAWTSDTLLARELDAARRLEGQDGQQRAFVLSADEVGQEVPAYRRFVAEQVARLGRSHPMVKSQFYSEEIDVEASMFPPARVALMQGTHPALDAPRAGLPYAFLIDVAGEDENSVAGLPLLANAGRDFTALTIVEVDVSGRDDPGLRAPRYRVVRRCAWQGTPHPRLYAEVRALAEAWRPRHVVVDATGVGAGLAAFLSKALAGRVIPFCFNASTKSRLGWDFLALVETGRFKDYQEAADGAQTERGVFLRQLAACRMEVSPGPERRAAWGVPDGARDPASGELLHDDYVISAALCALLDEQDFGGGARPALVVRAPDVLRELDHGF